MKTKTLEYIIAIAEEKSISRAAERYYLSHPALSRHLRNVERDLGAPLFVRTSDGMCLTPAGIIFVNDAREILHIESNLNKELNAMRHRKKRKIRVMTDTPFYNSFVQTVAPKFQEKHPSFILEHENCNSVQARRALLEERADLGMFHALTLQAPGLEYLSLGDAPVYLAFPKGFDGPTDISGLRSAIEGGMSISLYPVGSTARMIQEQQLAAHQIYPNRILEGGARNCIDYISQGHTCGILPGKFCTASTEAKLTIGDLFYRTHIIIAYSRSSPLSPAAQDLMQIIIEAFPTESIFQN